CCRRNCAARATAICRRFGTAGWPVRRARPSAGAALVGAKAGHLAGSRVVPLLAGPSARQGLGMTLVSFFGQCRPRAPARPAGALKRRELLYGARPRRTWVAITCGYVPPVQRRRFHPW